MYLKIYFFPSWLYNQVRSGYSHPGANNPGVIRIQARIILGLFASIPEVQKRTKRARFLFFFLSLFFRHDESVIQIRGYFQKFVEMLPVVALDVARREIGAWLGMV